MDGWICGWMDCSMNGFVDRLMDQWIDQIGWNGHIYVMNGWMDQWMDGQKDGGDR